VTKSDILRIAILLPNGMAVRNFIETPILQLLAEQEDLSVAFLTGAAGAQGKVTAASASFCWRDIYRPASTGLPFSSLADRIRHIIYRMFRFWVRGKIGYGILAYRFNEIHQFAGHTHKKNLDSKRKLREMVAGNYVFRLLGFPFPKSRRIFDWLYHLYYSMWDYDGRVEAFFQEFDPTLLVVGYPQEVSVHPYIAAARRRGVATLVHPGSWDRLTSKGPMPPGVDRYIVLNQIMRDELIELHDVPPEIIEVVGWPQMDYYQQPEILQDAGQLWRSLNVDPQTRILLFAANSSRLGGHEPGVIRHLVRQIESNAYGCACTLIIRPHPSDSDWQRRFGQFALHKRVVLQEQQKGQLEVLASMLYHADVVIASQGSITVDAVGMDACVVNIAFDGELQDVPYYKSVRRMYELDHYRPVVESGGVDIVSDYAELDRAIKACLDDPARKARSRKQLRGILLDPFDGRASERIVSTICQMAETERCG
jgi:hypothetical protein